MRKEDGGISGRRKIGAQPLELCAGQDRHLAARFRVVAVAVADLLLALAEIAGVGERKVNAAEIKGIGLCLASQRCAHVAFFVFVHIVIAENEMKGERIALQHRKDARLCGGVSFAGRAEVAEIHAEVAFFCKASIKKGAYALFAVVHKVNMCVGHNAEANLHQRISSQSKRR